MPTERKDVQYLFVALNINFFPMLTTFICAPTLQKQEAGKQSATRGYFWTNKHEWKIS